MSKCPHCGQASANDADLLKEPSLAAPEAPSIDGEASAKDEVLSELIEIMQSAAASKLPKKEEDEEFVKGQRSVPITGSN